MFNNLGRLTASLAGQSDHMYTDRGALDGRVSIDAAYKSRFEMTCPVSLLARVHGDTIRSALSTTPYLVTLPRNLKDYKAKFELRLSCADRDLQ